MDELEELKNRVKMLEEKVEKLEAAKSQPRQYVAYIQPRKTVEIRRERKSLFELFKTNGRSILTLIASILIFIGLIAFATLALDTLGVWAQVVLMYAFSGALYLLGLIMFKRKNSPLYLSLWGCGVGTIYISLFATRFYFNLFSDIGMYAALSIWSLIILFIYTKIQNDIPINIASIAISLSVIFGGLGASSIGEFTFVLVYFSILISTFTFFLNKEHSYTASIFMCIFSFLALLVYSWNLFQFIDSSNALSVSLLCLSLSVYLPLKMGHSIQSITDVGLPIRFIYKLFVSPMVISVFSIIKILFLSEVSSALLLFIPVVLILGIFTIFEFAGFPDYTNIVRFFSILGILCLFAEVCSINLLPLITSVFMLYFLYKNDIDGIGVVSINWLIYLFIITPNSYGISLVPSLISLVLSSFFIFYIYYKLSKKNINLPNIQKILLLAILVFSSMHCGIGMTAGPEISDMLAFLLGGIPIIVSQQGIMRFNWETKEIDERYVKIISVLSLIVMFVDLGVAIDHSFTVLAVALAILAFGLNNELKHLSTTNGKILGAKFLILCLGIMRIFVSNSEMPLMFTLLGIVVTIICTYVGLKLSNKSFRDFGIMLLIVSILKLLVLDIKYSSTLGIAFCFIFAGLLCFGVVWIYGKFENKKKYTTD